MGKKSYQGVIHTRYNLKRVPTAISNAWTKFFHRPVSGLNRVLGPNPEENGFHNQNQDVRPVDVRIREKLSDLKERLRETQNNQKRITEELEEKQEM